MVSDDSLVQSDSKGSIASNDQLVPVTLLGRTPEHGSELETKDIARRRPWRPGVEAEGPCSGIYSH